MGPYTQVHHCDMALDLALTLVYLEDLRSQVENKPELRERCRDAFNLMLGLVSDEKLKQGEKLCTTWKKAKLRFPHDRKFTIC